MNDHTARQYSAHALQSDDLPGNDGRRLLLSPIENEPQNQKDKNDDQDDPEDAADRKKNCHRHSGPFP